MEGTSGLTTAILAGAGPASCCSSVVAGMNERERLTERERGAGGWGSGRWRGGNGGEGGGVSVAEVGAQLSDSLLQFMGFLWELKLNSECTRATGMI